MAVNHPRTALSRIVFHWSRRRISFGTLMRYFFFRGRGFSGGIAGALPEFRLPTGGVALALKSALVTRTGIT